MDKAYLDYLEYHEEKKVDLSIYKEIYELGLEYLKLETKKINSKKFSSEILPMLKRMPNYKEIKSSDNGSIYTFSINTLEQYIEYGHKLSQLIEYFRTKKSANIYLNGVLMGNYIYPFKQFTSEMEEYIFEYTGYNLKPFPENNIGFDILSMNEFNNAPIIFYPPIRGTFFAFADENNTRPHFCLCQKKQSPTLSNYYLLTIIRIGQV